MRHLQTTPNGLYTMTFFRSLLWCLTLSSVIFLSACGGGGASTSTLSRPVQCQLDLQYANGAQSGIAINPVANAVVRQFNLCDIVTAESATLDLCIQHGNLSELSANLIWPDRSTLPLDLSTASHGSAACLFTGTLLTITVPTASLVQFRNLQGNWGISVTDQVPGYASGSFVGWSLQVKGRT